MGIFRQFPYSNFHEMNLDWIINTVKQLEVEWDRTKNEWASYKEFIDNYFENLDVSEEVLSALRLFAADGTLSRIIDPTIAAETSKWLAEHITITEGKTVIDSSLSIEGAAADAKATGDNIIELFNNLTNNNTFDIIKDQPNPESTTKNGVTYEWHDHVVTLTGTASPASFSNIYFNTSKLPKGVYPGDRLEIRWLSDPALLNIIWYNREGNVIEQKYIKGYETIKVPDSAYGCVIRVYVVSGKSVNDIVEPVILKQGFNFNIKYVGNVEQNGVTIDRLPVNTVAVCEGDEQGLPIVSAGYVLTFGSIARMQLFINSSRGRMYYRFATITNRTDYTYGPWVDMVNDWAYLSHCIQTLANSYTGSLNDAPPNTIIINSGDATDVPVDAPAFVLTAGSATESGVRIQYFMRFSDGALFYRRALNLKWIEWTNISSQGNAGATMYSVGNSILSGSVWTETTQGDYISAYGNAPYSVIADAMNISKENVEHHLYSSTGLLYDAGRGSFLNIIKNKVLSNVDVVLTHMWIQDMNNFQIGSIDSTADDGTLAGGVLELLKYIKSQNKKTQLVLCSVPPCDTVIKGENVFTGTFGNGSSISQLDTLMEQLAEREHFVYINWQDLNFAYWWQDLTWNGNNVHLSSEDAYRVFGAYAGARAAQYINF